MTAHVHAENMRLYAEDAAETEQPWERWQWRYGPHEYWQPLSPECQFIQNKEYRRRPRTITIGDMDVPEPMREAPKRGRPYYVIDLSDPSNPYEFNWECGSEDKQWLKSGICHVNREAAIQHAKALIKASGGKLPE